MVELDKIFYVGVEDLWGYNFDAKIHIFRFMRFPGRFEHSNLTFLQMFHHGPKLIIFVTINFTTVSSASGGYSFCFKSMPTDVLSINPLDFPLDAQ